jgi:phosphoadenosine phosphosulfate reductase
MPLEAPLPPIAERVEALNRRYRRHGAIAVLENALADAQIGRTALVSSFGAESVVLLHMVSTIDRTLPVLFIETGMLFPETLRYQREVAETLGLTGVEIIRPDRKEVFTRDHDGLLHLAEPDACCALRKAEPLARALDGFDAWITGRKRFQGGQRQQLDFFENEDDRRIKINPLAFWSAADLGAYIENNRLPRHPLVAKGYPSVGCAPCTGPVEPGRDPRAGRWPGMAKTECGIHFTAGGVQRGQAASTEHTDEASK